MNELMELSSDINQIELEIKHHKNIAGQSVWEIGRRLNHVKENDLVHGDFGKWLEKIDFSHYVANQFMKVAKELPNYSTSNNLGISALYLIATLPEEEREVAHTLETGETKTVDDMTVRELQEVKRKNKEQEKRIKELENQPTKVIEKEVIKEVIPEQIKDKIIQLEEDKRELDKLQEAGMSIEEYKRQKLDIDKQLRKSHQEYNDLTATMDQLQDSYDKKNRKLTDQATLLHEIILAVRPLKERRSQIEQLISSTDEVSLITAKSITVELETAYKILNEISKQLNTIEAEVIYYE